jgi:two-component system cell cycle response regulator DivK
MNRPILIIEDNEQNLYLMRFLLEASGLSIATANNGQDGVRLASELRPAAILLDIQLPVMDGYAVAEQIRKQSELAGVPIIAVTSYAMVGDRERILAAGATDYIEKPINPDTFVAQIRRHLESRQEEAIAACSDRR